MPSTVISVRNLGKKYKLGATLSPDTLRDHIMHGVSRLFHRRNGAPARPGKEEFWALKDVSFDVKQGEVLGVIGPNGSGKSTLLKILTGITEPTEGEVRMKGRVGSLLEVGTGFHQELTGRENIYMNGAILGMTRAEINAKFDEIVAFSGVEKFLDTPVKRYSSGMRVRLGFAVAAHFEPEILLIDEVLAVGDISFQKKCLGKMEEVAKGGRTILFVSHNMSTVGALCDRAVLVSGSRLCADGDVEQVMASYRCVAGALADVPVSERSDRGGNGLLRFTSLRFSLNDPLVESDGQWVSGKPARVELLYASSGHDSLKDVHVAITFYADEGVPLFVCDSYLNRGAFPDLAPTGVVTCDIPRVPLAEGRYRVTIWASVRGEIADVVRNAGEVAVERGNFHGSGKSTTPTKHGYFLVEHQWKSEQT